MDKAAKAKQDLEATTNTLTADQKFLVDLTAECEKKATEWDAVKKERQAELLALADTIKVLNDDDALELFKKTLPGASFMQVVVSSASARARARRPFASRTRARPRPSRAPA